MKKNKQEAQKAGLDRLFGSSPRVLLVTSEVLRGAPTVTAPRNPVLFRHHFQVCPQLSRGGPP